mmetsp:Transcript_37749/g.79883  ORF Transcript_37749/g.79883 Transcript_37749/m.79883 type:complete len:208 (+) Transcript_37749:3261-3884(+)
MGWLSREPEFEPVETRISLESGRIPGMAKHWQYCKKSCLSNSFSSKVSCSSSSKSLVRKDTKEELEDGSPLIWSTKASKSAKSALDSALDSSSLASGSKASRNLRCIKALMNVESWAKSGILERSFSSCSKVSLRSKLLGASTAPRCCSLVLTMMLKILSSIASWFLTSGSISAWASKKSDTNLLSSGNLEKSTSSKQAVGRFRRSF